MKKGTLHSEMIAYFEDLAMRYPADTVKRIGWGSRLTQSTRFDVFTSIGNLENKQILDVGAGVGDFYDYLKKKGISVHYTGYDLIADNCRAAEKKYGKDLFFNKDVLDTNEENVFDYVFASGIFFLPANDWEESVNNILRRMFALCKIGMAANFLSIYSPKKKPTSFYVDPGKIIEMCSQMTKVFNLRHDYAPSMNDFTLLAYRETA